MKKIQIDSISQDKTQYGVKTTFMSGKDKYSFYDTKKDGGHTKAFEQFNRFGFKVGDVVSAEVKEEEKSFVNDNGKNVTYTQRTIIFFEEIENVPMVTKPIETEVNKIMTPSHLSGRFQAIEDRLKRVEDAVFNSTSDNFLEDGELPEEGGIKAEDIPF